MVVNRKLKTIKYRGKTTHGCGSKKKNRGTGNRGGKGNAGSGKRADSKKPTIINLYGNKYFGKHGFHRPQKVLLKIKTTNIGYVNDNLNKFTEKNLVESKAGMFVIDLNKLGYDKLLGKGILTNKLKITAGIVSRNAKKKIEEKGGVVETNESDAE